MRLVLLVLLLSVSASVQAATWYVVSRVSISPSPARSYFGGDETDLCRGAYGSTQLEARQACFSRVPQHFEATSLGQHYTYSDPQLQGSSSNEVSYWVVVKIGDGVVSERRSAVLSISLATRSCPDGQVPGPATGSCVDPTPPQQCPPDYYDVQGRGDGGAYLPDSVCYNGCVLGRADRAEGLTLVGIGDLWFDTYIGNGYTCEADTPGITATPRGSDGENCGTANGIQVCVNPPGAGGEGCGTFNGEMICASGAAGGGPNDQPPGTGCITKGDITACGGNTPNTSPPRPSKDPGGATPQPAAGTISGGAGSSSGSTTNITTIINGGHMGGYDSGGTPEGAPGGQGGNKVGDDNGDGKCDPGEACATTPKVEVRQHAGWDTESQALRLAELEAELQSEWQRVKGEVSELFGSLPESSGSLPDLSFNIPWPSGGTIAVNWNLNDYREYLSWIAAAIMFIAVVIGIAIIFGD